VRLADALRASLPFVETGFRDQPLVEARLRMTLGSSFRLLGDAQVAIDQNAQARALRSVHFGPDHPDTLMSMNNLAVSYRDAGRHAEALKLHEETLPLRRAKLGRDHPDTLWSMNNLAVSHLEAIRESRSIVTFCLHRRLGRHNDDGACPDA
jgi:hypothetical protein